MDASWKAGLEDVIAARSAVCAIDGAAGRLFYRGYEIGELAGVVPFEEVTALLWSGEQAAPARPASGPAAPRSRRRPAARTRRTCSGCSRAGSRARRSRA